MPPGQTTLPGANDDTSKCINTSFSKFITLIIIAPDLKITNKMIRIVMPLSEYDARNFKKETFIVFRKTLKKLAVEEYNAIYETTCDKKITKKILKSIKRNTRFTGEIPKHNRVMNNDAFARLLAETVFTIFRILCSMSSEFHVRRHMNEICGIVNDVERETSAVGRIVHAINVIESISGDHGVFSMLHGSITQLQNYIENTFGCHREEYSESECSE